MVIALLRAGRGRHADDHRPFAEAAQLLQRMRGARRRDDNSRNKMHNVRGDSSAILLGRTEADLQTAWDTMNAARAARCLGWIARWSSHRRRRGFSTP